MMHRLWQVPELLIQIITFLPASDIDRSFHISHHFRTTLRANLSPQFRPLPDTSPKRLSNNQTLPQDVRSKAAAYVNHEAATPKHLKVEDAYYYWREDTRRQVFCTLSPYLHPVLSKHTTSLVDGYESLASGHTNIVLQTNMPYHSLYSLVHGTDTSNRNELLAVMPPTSVTVFCLGGVSWDLLYANVKYREYGGVKRFSVRVEREEGVRLDDVLDELKGTLVVDGMSGGLGQDVVLVWVLDDCWEG